MKKIKDIEELKQLSEKRRIKAFILLNFGIRSSKEIKYNRKDDTWTVFNSIDGTTLKKITIVELKELTNIPLALERGALYKY